MRKMMKTKQSDFLKQHATEGGVKQILHLDLQKELPRSSPTITEMTPEDTNKTMLSAQDVKGLLKPAMQT